MRLEGNDRKNNLIEESVVPRQRSNVQNFSSITNFLQHLLHFDTCPKGLTTWLLTNTMQIHVRYKKVMATEIQCRSIRRRLKFGHSYQTYNVDLCQMDTNLSTNMTIQMWIHARKNVPLVDKIGSSSLNGSDLEQMGYNRDGRLSLEVAEIWNESFDRVM